MQEQAVYHPTHQFLVCVDSDGCVFDTMEIKHKECFCPAAIEHFDLQPVSKYARDAWDFVNLYSKWRGIHRLPSLIKVLDLLSERAEVRERGFTPPSLNGLRQYIQQGGLLSNEGLKRHLALHPDDIDIQKTLAWSLDVNERIGRVVRGIPPFPHVREALEGISRHADIVVVSATEQRAAEREWEEHGLAELTVAIKGQESGNKQQIIASMKDAYPAHHVIMVGDAPGDMQAAHANGALFYPIRPDQEADSWEESKEGFAAFLSEKYAGAIEEDIIRRFSVLLPSAPPWKTIP